MVGQFSQYIEHVEVSREARIVRKKVWVNNEWRDLVKYSIQMSADSTTRERVDWLADTYGNNSTKWSYHWGNLTMDEDVYTMYKLRWE